MYNLIKALPGISTSKLRVTWLAEKPFQVPHNRAYRVIGVFYLSFILKLFCVTWRPLIESLKN